MERPNWNTVWMNVAEQISTRSVDSALKVGAIITTDNNTQILSLGYNGDHAGGSNEKDSNEPGMSGFIHAEVNAIIKLDYHHPSRKKMYCTHSPCLMCAKAIINANIKEVYYKVEYRDLSGIKLLEGAGILVKKI